MGAPWEKMHESILRKKLKTLLGRARRRWEIITQQVTTKQAERVWTEFICSEQGPMTG
jgi:hypothetical protein